MQQRMANITSQLDSTVKELDQVTAQVVFSKQIQDIMYDALQYKSTEGNYFDENRPSKFRVQETLMSINSPKDISRRVSVFNNGCNFLSVGSVVENSTSIQEGLKGEWIHEVLQLDGKCLIRTPHMDEWLKETDSGMVISVARTINATMSSFPSDSGESALRSYQTGETLGVVEVQQSYRKIEDICGVDDITNFKVIVLNQNNDLIYPIDANAEEILHFKNLVRDSEMVPGSIVRNPVTDIDELVNFTSSSYTGWTVVTALPRADFMKPVYTFQRLICIAGGLLILITLLLTSAITKSLTMPIRELRNSLSKVSIDNFSLDIDNRGENNEIILLNQAFHDTLERLNESVKQTLQARISESHAQLLALQAQMNPHFLFNSLMAISSVGVEIDNRQIVTMCAQLSDMLRYTASYKNTHITLKDELKHAQNYLNLTKWRYQDLLEFYFDIASDMLEISVPKLILQPIIENSINHGFQDTEPPWKVSVVGRIEHGCWKITVSDNGSGFAQNYMDHLKEELHHYRDNIIAGDVPMHLEMGGLGLLNIYIRLKMYDQHNAIFDVSNSTQGGAVVIIGGSVDPCGEGKIC